MFHPILGDVSNVSFACPLTLKQGKLKERRLQQLAAALVQEEAAAAAKVEEGRTKGTKKGEEGEGEGGAQPAVARVTVGELRCVFCFAGRSCLLDTYLEIMRPHTRREGPNPGALLALKLVLPLGQLEHPPSSFIVLDKVLACACGNEA